jgi:MFS transporter, SP family, general alpha glucoside:H+ symporter
VGEGESGLIQHFAQELAEQLIKFQGCCNECYQAAKRNHMEDTNEHISLAMYLGTGYLDCFRGRVNLRRTEIACLTWICQTICGSSFMGNSTYFYEQAGLADSSAFDLTIAQFALGFIGTVLSWPLMARVGRRKIYVWGLFLLTVILFVTGCLGIPPKAASRSWGIGSLLLVYTFTYDITVGPVCYSLFAELPSSRLRQRTIVLARNAYNIVGVAYTNNIGLYSLNPTAWNWGAKSAFFWAGNCALCFVWAYFRLPEPKDRSYAELDMLFDQGVSARKFATTYVNPYETERRSGQDSDSKGKVMSHVE